MKYCLFCMKQMKQFPSLIVDEPYETYNCRSCKSPKHQTFYKEIWDPDEKRSISDHFLIDDFYVDRYFYGNATVIFKSNPVIYNKVCKFNTIAVFDFSDLDKLKKKLHLYSVFS